MKPLYFAASYPPRHAAPILTQVHESLRPYTAYLKSALTAAKKREARSHCGWEPVPREHKIRLEPMDSLVILEADGFAYRVADWLDEIPDMPLFVGKHYRPVTPKRAEASSGGVTLVLDEQLDPDEQVFWAGKSCALEPADTAWPSKLIARRGDADVAHVLQRRDSASNVILVVEGAAPTALVDGHDAATPYRLAEPHEGATRLSLGRSDVPWTGQRALALATLPDDDILVADNGIRWRWRPYEDDRRDRRRQGVWVQLLAPDDVDVDSAMDVRAAYCDEGVREVRTKKSRNPKDAFKVWGLRRDEYQLELDRLPPADSTLFIQSNTTGLKRQRGAIFRLKDSPLPHHRALLKLCESPAEARWSRCTRETVGRWYLLDDERWLGTLQQREFVEKALGTPDFAFLEGPPGSGKTHAICELVLQFIDRGLNVLLCSTTHVAVDNVLERLVGNYDQVEAVRIGVPGRVDEAVKELHLDERIHALTRRWRDAGRFADLDDEALRRAAEATVLSSVNLTCGTASGIGSHPVIRGSESTRDGDTSPRWPYFDVLIVDEASKSPFQEFLVPAQFARRWIIVGDVRQLPPFSEPKDLEASIAEISNEKQTALPDAHQRALLLLFRLKRREAGDKRLRWLIEEPTAVLEALVDESEVRAAGGEPGPELAHIVVGRSRGASVSVSDIEAGAPAALRVYAADWILFPPELRDRLEPYLPADGLALREWDSDSAVSYRFARWLAQHGQFSRPVEEKRHKSTNAGELAARQRDFLREETWAKQIAWRLGRVHQLASARNDRQRENRQSEVDALMPAVTEYAWVPDAVAAIRDVGVRSVIETLRVRRIDHRVRKLSALTEAIPQGVWDERAVLLEYQHRMHPDISKLPREQFYEGQALADANTLEGRDARVGWSFAPNAPSRRVWVDVYGREERGQNQPEIDAMQRWLEGWREHAQAHPRKDGEPWTVACLSFYNRQAIGTRDMLRRLTGQPRAETRFALPNTAISCATVDSFQGREADMVLLSLRNTSRPGHMDSPNRLNVGITRARFLLVVFGRRKYFAQECDSAELNAFAKATPLFDAKATPLFETRAQR
jgi:hypothetical protein